MKLSDHYDGSKDPFEGDRTLLLKTIPVGARITRASATITPIDATGGVNPFTETITFNRASGDWGATKTTAVSSSSRWVEVDFHTRRTLSSVTGSSLQNSTLQVDIGGAFVEINTNGGIKTPNDSGLLTLHNNSEALPSLTVTKLKLTNLVNSSPPSGTPDLTQVTIRSTPTNVTLRLGDLPALWTRPGEMVQPESTPDFTTALQVSLSSDKTENGFYILPLILHSDTIARLMVLFEIEYLIEQSVLPDNLEEVTLTFDFSGTAQTRGDILKLEVPPNSRLSARGTKASVKGTFDDTRLVSETKTKDVPSNDLTVEISPTQSQAQPVTLSQETLVTDVDLLFRVARTVRLQLDLRENFDGKPASASLLPAPVEFELAGHTGEAGKDKINGEQKWVSVHLPAEFKFKAQTTYWLVLQSVEDEVAWFVTSAPAETLRLQSTNDGGLSWRATALEQETGALKTFFRLRRKPTRFEMPIELRVGEGDKEVRLGLERFQALGRVDFTLDANDLAGAVNQYLSQAAPAACPEIDHLCNGDFEQWLRVGDTLSQPTNIPLAAVPFSLAIAPDGTWGYVGLRIDNATGSLQILDAACQALRGDEIRLTILPDILLISSDGKHAFVSDHQRIQVIDTGTHQTIGTPFDPCVGSTDGNLRQLEAIALSPDGGRLYVIQGLVISGGTTRTTSPERELYILDTAKLLQAIAGGQSSLDSARIARAELSFPARATALAVAPDESKLYATVTKADMSGELHILDISNLDVSGEVVDVGHRPLAVALTPDGKQALVVNYDDNSISVITTSNGSRSAPASLKQTLSVGEGPCAIAIAPDGVRAYIVNYNSGTLTYIDVTRRSVINTVPIGASPTALALTPQADTIYAIHPRSVASPPNEDILSAIQIGLRQPVEWNLTSGWVRPVCLPEPFLQVAILGQQLPAQTIVDESKMMATGLSQVVPVAENCAYDFNFWGLASEPDALAEVFWLNSECKLLQPDEPNKVFIEALPVDTTRSSLELAFFRARRTIMERAPLILHRRRLTTPKGAVQAEIRFSVPSGALAAIEGVSLVGTNEALENSDLSLQREGRLVGWQLSPGTAPGVSLFATEEGVQFRNAGANTAELIQTVPAEAKKIFTLEWQGQTEVRQPAREDPRLELYWLDANKMRVGEPTILELSPAGFGASTANGATPATTTQAEIHLIVPAGTIQKVKRVSLRFLSATVVPVTFIAEAPGELTVLDWRVAFERAEVVAPRIPEGGLCQPTPPGQAPGAVTNGDDTHFCPHCAAQQNIANDSLLRTRSQRPATMGRCTSCGNEVVRFSGQSSAAAPQFLSISGAALAQPLLHLSGVRSNITFAANLKTRAVAPSEPFAAIKGIGDARTRQLVAIGIDSIEALSHATPEDVAQAKGIPLPLAANFIAQAREFLFPKT